MARGEAHESVVDRVFRVLGAFDVPGEELGLANIAVRAALPKPTAHRLASALVSLGALEKRDDGRYVLGLRLLELAALAPRVYELRTIAMPYMEDLHAVTRQHVMLAVREGDRAVMVERLSARGSGAVLYHVGGSMPLHSTGVGRVLLAHAPRDLQEEILARTLVLEPERTPLPARELRAALAVIRRDNLAVVHRTFTNEFLDTMSSVAAPIRAAGGEVVAALSVITWAHEVAAGELRAALLTVARAISRQLVAGAHPRT
ncbi:IclR family transcriptional regulator [Mycolicibacterium stellerae]|uniref:IclR family transcriptional regulator n=1 Tax=Mycolicibacterium stellerae TaxID=2358193 RepID=UPI000F0B76D4|nr:IclR family transcriptional regulator [Mycolicibacterium stellerae]